VLNLGPASPSTHVDVLVVGAGPTGLMPANQLGNRGVRTMIIVRHAGPARETRALGVQARPRCTPRWRSFPWLRV